jgi:predicted glycosyltransferase
MFKYVIRNLIAKGHIIKVTINTKDILEQLLIADGMQYENILPKRRSRNTKMYALLTLLKKDIKILQIQFNEKYDLLVGTETALSHIGWLFHKPVLIMDEDDISVIPVAARVSFPFATYIVSPVVCNLGKWSKKKISYTGYQKTAYLHPAYFSPKEDIIRKTINKDERFFLIRASGLSAYHDNGIKGFTDDIIRRIIDKLTPFGEVLLSTERQLPDDLNKFLFIS